MAGSWAAVLMSTYGGAVPAGSLCAVLQSVGAAGLATSTVAGMEATAAALATGCGVAWKYLRNKRPPANTSETSEDQEDDDEGTPAITDGSDEKGAIMAAKIPLLVTGVSVVAVVAASPVLVPAAVAAAGFGAGGITAGSWAAVLMSTYGGAVPAGSLCAVLQSVGAAGLATSTIAGMEATAAALATGCGVAWKYLRKKRPPADTSEDQEDDDEGTPAITDGSAGKGA